MSRLSNARSELERFEQTKPADYQSKYKGQIDNVMGKLDDLGGYDYDPAADTAYQQYKSEYTQKAKLANQNAQASASALTGGYGSSYGTQAGQKDSLTSQSRSEYNTKKSGLQQELNGLQEAEQNDYNKYQKDLSNWYNDLSYRQNEYNNAYAQRQQNVSSTLNGLFSVLGIAAQILPFFFI